MTSKSFKDLLVEIRAEQTLFSLPFVYTGALLGANFRPTIWQLLLVTTAAAAGRTLGMLLNRIIDRVIDRLNPRTASRFIASGKMPLSYALFYTFLALFIYLLSAYLLGPLPLLLSPIPLFFFTFYPYTKRFTWMCHFFLGITLGLAPLAGWIAVNDQVSAVPFLLLAGVAFWVAGFDIIYATMDVEFDRKAGIHSIPARFGNKTAFVISVLMHILSLLSLIAAGLLYPLGTAYFILLTAAGLYLMYNDLSVKNKLSTQAINSYLQRNSYFSVIVFAGILIELLLR